MFKLAAKVSFFNLVIVFFRIVRTIIIVVTGLERKKLVEKLKCAIKIWKLIAKTHVAKMMSHVHVIVDSVVYSWIFVELVKHTLRTEYSNISTCHWFLVDFGRLGRTVFPDFAEILKNQFKPQLKYLLFFEIVHTH